MKKFYVLIIIATVVSGLAFVMRDDGLAGRTGSPGETTCNTSGCHVGNTINAMNGSIAITAPTLVNWEYIPGQVYPISVTIARSGVSLFGIGFEALRSSGANGGTLSITNPTQTTLKNIIIGGNNRTNVVHQLNGGASPNSHTFTFNWTAPSANIGNITFYAAGNAANGNGSTSGDFIYTISQVVTPSTVGLPESNLFNKSLVVYPNPVTEKINVQFTLVNAAQVEINLMNMQGKLVKSFAFEKRNNGDHNEELLIGPEFERGIYFLEIQSGEIRAVRKIVII